jgi:class 3 adenylate cyclase
VSNLRATSHIGLNRKEYLAILAADMRGSSALAEANTADDMFVLIQCFIPLLAFIVRELGGEVVGLRGDGLIAAFGVTEKVWRPCINVAYEAGMIMVEATRDELNPFLLAKKIPMPQGIGVGVDCGKVTITKIGLGDAIEVTAYGTSVNQAAKKSNLVNQLWLSSPANKHLHKAERQQVFTQAHKRLTE